MTALDRELLTIEASFLYDHYGMSYRQIAKYLSKYYVKISYPTVYRLLNS
jgi:Fe2+ or Zn2+ uptake regulation protein